MMMMVMMMMVMMMMMLIATIVIPSDFQYYRILWSTIVEACGSIMNCGGIIAELLWHYWSLKIRQVTVVYDRLTTAFWSFWGLPGMPWSSCMRWMAYGHPSHIGNFIIMNRYTHANQNGLITIPNKRKQSMFSPIMNYHYIYIWILMNYHDLSGINYL